MRKLIVTTCLILSATFIHAATPVKYSAPLTALPPLTNAPPVASDGFGRDCAVTENSMLIGFRGPAPWHGGYQFYRQDADATWSLIETKAYSSGALQFGRSVAINQDAMAVGGIGAVRVRTKNALGEWGDEVLIEEPEDSEGTFGFSLALDGSTLAVGAYKANNWYGYVYIYTNDGANAWYLEDTLENKPDCDYLGWALDINNDTLAIGAYESNIGALADAGEVAVYQRVNGTWTFKKKMNSAATQQNGAKFGYTVALSDRWLMIGDRGDVGAENDAGHVYVYDLSQDGWPLVQTLTDTDVQAGAYFSDGIAIDGNLAVIGSWAYDDGASQKAGRACLFFYDGSEWSFVRALPWPVAANSYFGKTVALSRNHVVSSAYVFDDPESDCGAVFAYNVDQGNLKTSTTAFDYMGKAIGLSQNRLAVGVKGASWGGYSHAGQVNVYRRHGTDWTSEATLTATAPQNNGYFGDALAMSGNTLMVGSKDADPDGHSNAGCVTFFTRSGTTWTRKTTINGTASLAFLGTTVAIDGSRAVASYSPSGPFILYPDALISMVNSNGTFEKSGTVYPSGYNGEINFGCSAAIDGDLLVVGADGYNSGAGAVFFYTWSSANSKWESCAVKLGLAGDGLGCSVAIGGEYIAAGAPEDDTNRGFVRIYKNNGGTITTIVNLKAPNAASGDYFGSAVAFTEDGSLLIGAKSKDDGSEASTTGAIYLYRKSGSSWTFESVTYPPRKAGVDANSTFFGRALAVEGSTVASGMYKFKDDNKTGAGAGVVYEITPRVAPADFDGDGITDIGCYFAPQGYWYVYKSATSALWVNNFGYAGTTPFVADFDGDWLTDFGCFDPGSALWFFYGSSRGFWVEQFGNPGTERITGDFDGDGLADHGVFDPSIPKFFFMCSSDGYQDTIFGTAGSEAVTGDFDGDGICDYGTYYPPSGLWEIHCSTDDDWETNFGYSGTTPVTGDFDGDGVMDFGCYYPPVGAWYFYESTAGFCVNNFGYEGTIPVTGDFDGDGVDDFGCYYPPQGTWYIYGSTDGFSVNNFGYEGTVPMY